MSNKTLSEQPVETESAPKQTHKGNSKKLFVTVLIIGVGALVILNIVSSLFDNTLRLIAPAGNITVEVADTDESRARGLSGHEPLTENEGMLFVFDQVSADNCFWMKDMTSAIDMVWLDAERQVLTVTPDVAPSSYPDTFCPDLPAKYGLELASGRAKTLEIVPDAKLRW